ncbi:MAG: hypothetical protein QXF26_07675, partial [Candidatus Bathyarchaeia archaeon]
FEGKLAAIMGASTGMSGTAREQYHLGKSRLFERACSQSPRGNDGLRTRQIQCGRGPSRRLKIRAHVDALVRWTEKLR